MGRGMVWVHSQAAGTLQRQPAEPAVAVDGAGDVEGAVGDAEEAVLRAVGVVIPAEVGRRIFSAELWRGEATGQGSPDPLPSHSPQLSQPSPLTCGIKCRHLGTGRSGEGGAEAEPFWEREEWGEVTGGYQRCGDQPSNPERRWLAWHLPAEWLQFRG